MRATATISQSALRHNLSVVRSYTAGRKIVRMVKANAYGHGLDFVAPLINNADILAVSELSEAAILRTKTHCPILLLPGVYSIDELQYALSLDCQLVIHHPMQITLIEHTKQPINVWVKIDTGMRRLGLSSKQYIDCLSKFNHNKLINIVCVMSHFACADRLNHPMNARQLAHFNQLTNHTFNRSMANSAAILSQTQSLFDIVRPGIMLYGASPFPNIEKQLKPVMQLSAPILSIKTIQKGDSVGYGATWTAMANATIATVGIGYGDGYPRHAKNTTPVLINDSLCPLLGRVSMDLICVDISNTSANIGDKVILWGDEKLRVETVADCSNTIGYELLTGLSSRVKIKAIV